MKFTHPGESGDIGCLMTTSEPPLVALPVGSNVLLVTETQLLDGSLYNIDPTIFPHRLSAEKVYTRTKIEALEPYSNSKVSKNCNFSHKSM